MDKNELIRELHRLEKLCLDDTEVGHQEADKLLLRYINDIEVESAFYELERWYA